MKVDKWYLHMEEMLDSMAMLVVKNNVLDSYGKSLYRSHI